MEKGSVQDADDDDNESAANASASARKFQTSGVAVG